MSIKVVFADLDGTLLNKQKTISNFTREVLHRLHLERPDVKFVIATGRPYQDVLESMKLLNLHPDYIISNNGAVVHQGDEHARVAEHTLKPDVVQRLLAIPLAEEAVAAPEAAEGTAVVPVVAANLYREQGWFSTYNVKGLGASYRPSFQPQIVRDLPEQQALHHNVYSIFFYGPHEHLEPIEKALQRNFTEETTFSYSLPFILDVAPPGVDKGTAVRDVLELLHLHPDEAAAFGDGMNDLPMLTAVRHGFAMANSLPDLFAAAPDLARIGHHDEDGVAKKLLELFFS